MKQTKYSLKLSLRKKKKKTYPATSVLLLVATKNNIRVSLTDIEDGSVFFWTSSGKEKLKGRKKSSSTASSLITSSLLNFLETTPIKSLHVQMRGRKRFMDEIVINLSKTILILSISDVTVERFNGTRPKGRRRV